MRILITGSRNWRHKPGIALAISDYLESIGKSIGALPIPMIVHGAQKSFDRELRIWYGADVLVDRIATNWGFGVERHPADWDRYGKSAGPRRNQEMVDLGADVCLGFPLGASIGTRDCMTRAVRAGIEVRDCSSYVDA